MLVSNLSNVLDIFPHLRHNLLLMNLYFIPGAFYCFYKCWHLFQQQQAIHFWILSHLKLLELLNSQGQHWVMFLTEKLYFVFHQKKIHVNAFLPNDHFIPSHLIVSFFPISEYNIHIFFPTMQASYVPFWALSLFFFFFFLNHNRWYFFHPWRNEKLWKLHGHLHHPLIPSPCLWPVWPLFHALRLPGVSYWTISFFPFPSLLIIISSTSFQDHMHFSSLFMSFSMCLVTPSKSMLKLFKYLILTKITCWDGVFVFSAPSETPFVPPELEIFTSPEMQPTTPGN